MRLLVFILGFISCKISCYADDLIDQSIRRARSPTLLFIQYSKDEIEEEREKMRDDLNAAYQEVYDMAQEAMNFEFKEVVHHGIQAKSHALDAWDHYREAKRMERERIGEDEEEKQKK